MTQVLAGIGGTVGGLDLEDTELVVRSAMHRLGASLLEKLLGLDHGHRGQSIDCSRGHQAVFAGYREKDLTTVLGPLRLRRAYYHCRECGTGVVPKDQQLGVAKSSLSPGVRRMAARTGSQEPAGKNSGVISKPAETETTQIRQPTKLTRTRADAPQAVTYE